MEQVGVDIAARNHAELFLAVYVELSRVQRRKNYGATRFVHDLQLAD